MVIILAWSFLINSKNKEQTASEVTTIPDQSNQEDIEVVNETIDQNIPIIEPVSNNENNEIINNEKDEPVMANKKAGMILGETEEENNYPGLSSENIDQPTERSEIPEIDSKESPGDISTSFTIVE